MKRFKILDDKTKTEMEQYQEWYNVLENAGFKRTGEKVGNIDYQHPKKPHHTIYFDWATFQVAYKGIIIYETINLDLGKLDAVIHDILWPKTGNGITKPQKGSTIVAY